MTSTAIAPRLVAFSAPSAAILAILDASETVRVRLVVLLSAMNGDQRDRQLQLLAVELRALGQTLAIRASRAGCRGKLKPWR